MRSRSRLSLAGVVAFLLAAMLPTAATANGDCVFRSVAYSKAIPSSMRSVGTHHFQYQDSWLDPDGTQNVAESGTQIDVVPGTASYVGSVLLRPFSNWATLPDKSIDFDVQAIDPGQSALFFVRVAYAPEQRPLTEQILVRWETLPGQWSSWVSLPHGAEASYCSQTNHGLFLRF